jgi:hypothetical protein
MTKLAATDIQEGAMILAHETKRPGFTRLPEWEQAHTTHQRRIT